MTGPLTPPPGTAVTPVPGEPSQGEMMRAAWVVVNQIPGLDIEQVSALVAGFAVGAWRQGYWAGRRDRIGGRDG